MISFLVSTNLKETKNVEALMLFFNFFFKESVDLIQQYTLYGSLIRDLIFFLEMMRDLIVHSP